MQKATSAARRPARAGLWVGVLLSMAVPACAGSSARPAATPPPPAEAGRIESRMVGQWELVRFEVEREGRVEARPARGTLSYDEFATISACVELLPEDPASAPPRVVLLDFTAKATADPVREELIYVGLQTCVGADRLVPEAVEPHEWRRYAVDADTLRLSVASATGSRATLTWRRVGR
ncbi:MAG: hypothetical protein ACLGHP_06275 [Vicinamibacteria bacterium]